MWCLAPSPDAHHHAEGSSIPRRKSKSHCLPSCPDSTCSPSGYCTAMMSQPAPDQTVPGPLTVSHDASARHSKRAPTHPQERVHYGSVPSRRGTLGTGHTPQATPSCRGTRPPSQVEESTPCVYISMSLSNPNHTTQVCLKNTHVFQTTKTRTPTTVTTGSSELIGRRPAYQSGCPDLYSGKTYPRSNHQIIESTPQGLQHAHISCLRRAASLVDR